jgi:protein-tyrosine phosphatase
MLPFIDTHCHLHAGLDDGPPDVDTALEMCRIVAQDGVRAVAATAHQNPRWPAANAERIRSGTRELQTRLNELRIPLDVVPCGEVMVSPKLMDDWSAGRLVSVADAGRYLLIEMPHGVFLDIRDLVTELMEAGLRPILAHPERCPELWHSPATMVDWIRRGCVMQACADSIVGPDKQVHRQIRHWLARGWVHLVASDGHSLAARRPGLSAAFDQLTRWTNPAVAERLCCTNGMTILEGLPLVVPQPEPAKRRWFDIRRK